MAPGQYRIATEVAFVTLHPSEDGSGVVRLEQGDTLPEETPEDEVARLANGGVLEGFEPALGGTTNDEGDDVPAIVDGGVDEIKVRVGSDTDTARAYLEAENAREKPRTTLVAHLQQVIDAEDGADDTEPQEG